MEKIKHNVKDILYEIERKFLIEYPDVNWLENSPDCSRSEIVQTYLKSENDDEVRVRRRFADDKASYCKTVKRKVSDVTRIEIENSLSEEEYLELLVKADTEKNPIKKTRFCLDFEGKIFEIDVYSFWNDKAIAEVELTDENEEIKFPPQIKVIKEVTDDRAYKNSSLAKKYR